MTKTAFLEAFTAELKARYPWANDSARLETFLASVKATLDGANTWNKDGEASLTAWRKIGGKGPMTYKALRALAD